jgi:hypothetical protein
MPGAGVKTIERQHVPAQLPGKAIAAARGLGGPTSDSGHPERPIERVIRLAARHGLATASREDWEQLLWAKFDGNVFEIGQIIVYYDIVYYDEDDDELVINPAHPAWSDMRAYIQAPNRKRFFSSRSPDHITHHEIGHALHYRGMTSAERAAIWYKVLTREERLIATFVSDYSVHGRIEFVAEVYAGLCAGRRFRTEVMRLYEKLKGPPR